MRLIFFYLFFIILNTPLLAEERRPVVSLLELRQDKVVMQQWDLSCGAAALTTILKYQHSIDTTEKIVAKELISRREYIDDPNLLKRRQGFSLLDLKRYTKKIGFKGGSYGKLSLNDLLAFAPVITPVNLNGYNHFVIFRGKIGNRVLLADPAWGNRTLSVRAFNKAWIDFPKIGRVGFIVSNPNNKKSKPVNQLAITADDFTVLH